MKFNNGATVALPLSGALNWSLTLDNYTWDASSCNGCISSFFYEQAPLQNVYYGPAVIFNANGVYGVEGIHQQVLFGAVPNISTGVIDPPGQGSSFPTLPFDSLFFFRPGDGPPTLPQQTGQGMWDFANATVVIDAAVVPEPSTWAAMIAGMGLVGISLRRRRRLQAAA